MQLGDTIVSIITGSTDGAVSVLRVSGPKAMSIVTAACNKNVNHSKGYELHYVQFGKPKLIDQALLSVFKAPKSYTGEDVVEISLHASQYIVDAAVNELIAKGCRLAEAGEFTMRAYMNGKMDLAQAEAVADVIASQTQAEHKMALNQLKGHVSNRLKVLREEITNFAALIELELDFGEEDVEFASRNRLVKSLTEMRAGILKMAQSFKNGNAIKNGVPVAILGKPNAGKSTLLNQLLQDDRAIVSNIEGTTRDTIEEQITINDVRFRFIDTAGIRETENPIEKVGIERALAAASKASIVLYLYESKTQTESELKEALKQIQDQTEATLWPIANKVDIQKAWDVQHISISAGQGDISDLLIQLNESAAKLKNKIADTTISNQRHQQALLKAVEYLDDSIHALNTGMGGELLSLHLREAMRVLGSILGEIDNEEVLGAIFSKFCIGK